VVSALAGAVVTVASEVVVAPTVESSELEQLAKSATSAKSTLTVRAVLAAEMVLALIATVKHA